MKSYGQYIDLDFEYLVELSRLDKALRFAIMETALDIEHFMKVQMNRAMMDDPSCDARSIVRRFLEYDAQMKLSRIARNRTKPKSMLGKARAPRKPNGQKPPLLL